MTTILPNVLVLFLYLLSLMVVLPACDNSSSKTNEINPTRSGSELSISIPQYYDAQASLSADGTRIAFISGRNSTDGNPVLRAYKTEVSWGTATDTAPSLEPVHSLEGVSDIQTVISPDGDTIVFVTSDANWQSLYSIDFSATRDAVLVLENPGLFNQISFSPDSSLIAFSYQSQEDNYTQIAVAQISSDGTASVKLVSDPDVVESQPVWINAATGYTLTTRTNGGDLVKRDFASFDTLTEPTASQTILSETYFYNNSPVAGSLDQLLYAGDDFTSVSATFNLWKDDGFDTETSFAATSYLSVVSNLGAAQGSFEVLGIDTSYFSASLQDNFAIATSTFVYQCGTLEASNSGNILNLLDVDNRSVSSRLAIYKDLDGNFAAITNPCSIPKATEGEGEEATEVENINYQQFDHSLSQAKLNNDATSGQYRVLYLSALTNDLEVMLMSTQDGTNFEFYNISANPSP